MVEWINPIYDRTSADVTRAKLKVQEWIDAIAIGEHVNISDLKGFINPVDLNRMENNVEYLNLSANLSISIKTDWKRTDFPNQADLNRIIGNINQIATDLEFAEAITDMPTTILNYKQANTIERSLNIIKHLLEDMSTHIQAEFTKISADIDSKIFITLAIPFARSFDNATFDITNKMRLTSSAMANPIFDLLEVSFTAPVFNSTSRPIAMRTGVDIDYGNKMADSPSNPITQEIIKQENAFLPKTINSSSSPITKNFDETQFTVIVKLVARLPNVLIAHDIATSMNTETTSFVLTTDSVISEISTIADALSVIIGFADMFIAAIFTAVNTTLDSTLFMPPSQQLTSAIDNNIDFISRVGLCAYAKLSTYINDSLSSMDNQTLKALAYSEII